MSSGVAMKEGSSSHSLAFRVMRLCRPSLQVDLPLRFDVNDLRFSESDTISQVPILNSGDAFSQRSELDQPLDACGLTGMMVLPQTFGQIFLGETFCSYISVGNHSDHDVRDVVVKAELQTERQRVTLSENKTEFLRSGGRYDFIIDHDIKELGPHTLVCSAVYVDTDAERKYLPQYFKFQASNPLSVRTKVRTVKDNTFLEACIENTTKAPLFLEHVRFDPAPSLTVMPLEAEDPNTLSETARGPLSDLFKKVNLVKASGGTRHFLYHLRKVPAPSQSGSPVAIPDVPAGSAPAKADGGNTLGKLEIMWRTTLGEPGRLQTQQILGTPTPRKEVEFRLVEPPASVFLERPFKVKCRLVNTMDRRVGPLRVVTAPDSALPAPAKSIVVSGAWSLTVPEMEPNSSHDFDVCLVALAAGVQKITGLGVLDVRDGKPYDTLPPLEVFVEVA